MTKLIEAAAAADLVKDGMTIMVGGFLACGSAQAVIDAIAEKGVKDLTLIINDAAYPERGGGKLIAGKHVRKMICSHIGTNPAAGELLKTGELTVELVPQGSLAEKIRCGGSGLGGILTPTGLGTQVAEGKQVITVAGKDYLLETPLRADLAILGGHTVDELGNVWYKGTSRNFNPIMAMAADVVVVEAHELVAAGTIRPEDVHIPGVLVDHIVDGSN